MGWDMAGKWRISELEDLCERVSVGYVGPTSEFFCDSFVGVRLLRSQNVRPGRLDLDDVKYVERDFHTKNKKSQLKAGDILFVRVGQNRGDCCVVPESAGELNCANIVFARPQKSLSVFLGFYFRSPAGQQELRAISTGSAQEVLNTRSIASLKVPVPPDGEAEAIAKILGTLDDKIELNRRMNATLEAMARALFQSWFVDFDPVRAKLDGRKPPGLDATTAALFPAYFQESSLGHIPQGWQPGVLNDLTDAVIGGDWGSTEPLDEENLPTFCIRGADIPSLQEGGIGKMPTRYLKRSSLEKRRLLGGDLAIEISGGSPTQSTGRPVLVSDGLLQRLEHPLVSSNFCRIVKLKTPSTSKFVYLWLRRIYDNGEFFQFENGTTGIKNLAFTLFAEKYPLVIPPPKLCEAFDRAVSPILEQHQANGIQSRTLATLRDTLLPKLLSGELQIADAEKIAGGSA